MKREDFIASFIGMCAKKANLWLAEEDTEQGHMKNMTHGIVSHNGEMHKGIEEYNKNLKEKNNAK